MDQVADAQPAQPAGAHARPEDGRGSLTYVSRVRQNLPVTVSMIASVSVVGRSHIAERPSQCKLGKMEHERLRQC